MNKKKNPKKSEFVLFEDLNNQLSHQNTKETINSYFQHDLEKMEEIYKLRENNNLYIINQQKSKIQDFEEKFKQFVTKLFESSFNKSNSN